jgi:hypothetical protein
MEITKNKPPQQAPQEPQEPQAPQALQEPQEIIKDSVDCEEMIKLLEDFYDINQIQRSLSMIIVKQRQKVNTIQNTMSDSTLSIENGFEDLKIAKQYAFRYIPIILGSAVGITFMGPIGLMFGFKTAGLITGLSGGMIGGWFGYKIQK